MIHLAWVYNLTVIFSLNGHEVKQITDLLAVTGLNASDDLDLVGERWSTGREHPETEKGTERLKDFVLSPHLKIFYIQFALWASKVE